MIEHMFDRLMDESGLEELGQAELWALWESLSPEPEGSVAAEISALDPGLLLAATLDEIDLESLSGAGRVAAMVALGRMVSHYQARLYAAMTSVADAVADTVTDDAGGDMSLVEDACASEIRAALTLTRRTADTELELARGFRERLPQVWEALASGRIDRRRASVIISRTDHLTVAQAREVADRVLERASELTTGQLSALIKRLGIEVDPDDATQRYETAVDQRRVVLEPGVDGTAHLYLMDLPPDRAIRIRAGIDAAARQLRRHGETRTMDQLRADVVLDLLDPATSHATPRSGRGAVTLTVDLATLTGLTESTASWVGMGQSSPISPARSLIGHRMPSGGSWSPTTATRSGRAPPAAAPPLPNAASSRRSIPDAFSWGVGRRRSRVTSITPPPTPTPVSPASTIWGRCVNTTTPCVTVAGATATPLTGSNGPAPSASATSTAPHPLTLDQGMRGTWDVIRAGGEPTQRKAQRAPNSGAKRASGCQIASERGSTGANRCVRGGAAR